MYLCMYVCIYIYIYTHTYIYIYTHIKQETPNQLINRGLIPKLTKQTFSY